MTRHICVASTHLARRLHRAVRPNCRPRAAVRSGLGAQIKHDGYRLIARRQNSLFSRRGHDGALPRASMMNAYTHAARPSGPTACSPHYCANSVRAPSFLRADHGALRGLLSDRPLTLAVGLSPEPFRVFGQALPGVFRPSFVRLGKLSAFTAERGASVFPASLGCDRQSSHAGLVDAAGITRSRKSLIDDRDRRRRIYQA
jgi:hypothetical protein